MTWANRARPIAIGDRVALSAAWLRSTGQYSGDIAHAKGKVIDLNALSADVTIATIDWDGNPDIPTKVITQNLCRVGERGYSA
jgi:hypothetical protein